MSIRILTITAATAALFAGAAGAQTTPQPRAFQGGQVQLALQAGVPPGRYSLTQLAQLIEAQELNQTNRVTYFLRQPFNATGEETMMSAAGSGTATFSTDPQITLQPRAVQGGQVQLALQAGVPPGRYSLAQLAQLIAAQELNQTNRVAHILRQPLNATGKETIMTAARSRTATFGTGAHSDANS